MPTPAAAASGVLWLPAPVCCLVAVWCDRWGLPYGYFVGRTSDCDDVDARFKAFAPFSGRSVDMCQHASVGGVDGNVFPAVKAADGDLRCGDPDIYGRGVGYCCLN